MLDCRIMGVWAALRGMGRRAVSRGFQACVVADRRAKGVLRRVPPNGLPPRRNCVSGRMGRMEVRYGV